MLDPAGPTLPCIPCGPVGPGAPVGPGFPCIPCAPGAPVGPGAPVKPVLPVGPTGPAEPTGPATLDILVRIALICCCCAIAFAVSVDIVELNVDCTLVTYASVANNDPPAVTPSCTRIVFLVVSITNSPSNPTKVEVDSVFPRINCIRVFATAII